MATLFSAIETQARRHLQETSASFWSSAELIDIVAAGVRDLWRDFVDLKAEYYFTRDNTNVSLAANTSTLTGVPADVHKVYLIEPVDTGSASSNVGLVFEPLDYNDPKFIAARSSANVDPANNIIYYAIVGQGAPVAAPTIYVAPKVTSAVPLSFVYIPTLGTFTAASTVPIPGEADNALIAWTIAYARAKEREDRAPDANWLSIYKTEKAHLLQSSGTRQQQEPEYVRALFEEYWS